MPQADPGPPQQHGRREGRGVRGKHEGVQLFRFLPSFLDFLVANNKINTKKNYHQLILVSRNFII